MATYNVQKNGNAQAGLKAGDLVQTAGGTYQILDANKFKGMSESQLSNYNVNYNPATGYYSQRVDTPTSLTKTNTNGATKGVASGKTSPATTSGNALSGSSKMGGLGTTSGTVSTNTSYNGNYVPVDLGVDYMAGYQKAVAEGDYYKAAQYEAARNAKINYLNSINANPNNYETTSNYIENTSGNNRDGQAWNGKWSYNDLKNGNLPDNWSTANIGGLRYKRDANGNMYNYTGTNADTGEEQWRLIGNGFNPKTGERTFANFDDAKQYAYDQYRSATGDMNGTLSDDYIRRIQEGTNDQYNQQQADKMLQEEVLAQAYYDRIYGNNNNSGYGRLPDRNDGWYQTPQGTINMAYDYINQANVPQEVKDILHTNSFETDPTLSDDYHVYGVRNYADPYSAFLQSLYGNSRRNWR